MNIFNCRLSCVVLKMVRRWQKTSFLFSCSLYCLYVIVLLMNRNAVYTNGMDWWERNDEEVRYRIMTLFCMETIMAEWRAYVLLHSCHLVNSGTIFFWKINQLLSTHQHSLVLIANNISNACFLFFEIILSINLLLFFLFGF
jgi:hypothetical protein